MDNTKYEFQVLKELKAIFEEPEATKRKYSKVSIFLIVVGIAVAFLLQYFSKHSELDQNLFIVGLVICGFSIGVGFFYNQASRQVPYLNEYTSANMDAINKRLNEINKT